MEILDFFFAKNFLDSMYVNSYLEAHEDCSSWSVSS